jgi:hypothetical protein
MMLAGWLLAASMPARTYPASRGFKKLLLSI